MENIIKLQKERAEVLRKIGEQVDNDREYWVNTLTKIEPRATAIDEMEKSIRTLKSYDKELKFLADRSPIGQFRISLPFNNPIYSFVIYCCGIAVGGNTVIVRPSKMTCDYVQEFFSKYEKFKDIGISLYIGSGKAFIEAACTQNTPGGLLFTGAFDNLQDIQNKIPHSQQLIYCGSGINPTIIGPNVGSIDDAVDLVINSRIYNSGQDCLSTEKIVVHESIYDEFIGRLICKLDKLHLGVAGDKTADIYPPILGIQNEITTRYNAIKQNEICLYDRHDNGCILSVFEVGLNSESLNMEKFCPIFTIAKYKQNDELSEIFQSEYRFGLTLLGVQDELAIAPDFPHIVTQGTVMQLEAQDAHIPFGGKGKSGFSRYDGDMVDGPILFSIETTKKIFKECIMNNKTLDTRPFYGGEHHDSFGKKCFNSINPATEQVIATIPESEGKDIESAINAAQTAFEEWNGIDTITRGHLIGLIAEAIEEHAEELVKIDVQDAGRPILDAREDIEAVVRMYRYFSGMPSKIEGTTIPYGDDKLVLTKHEPFGVVAAITAWNYPLFNATAKIAPIIATGNACILKPAEETPLVALRLAEIIASVPGIPKGLVSVLNGSGEITGKLLVSNPRIHKITFTGSTPTASNILKNISESNFKDGVFELGGKAPVVVFADANIEGAAKAIAFCALFNQGQTCTAATRIIVEKSVHDELLNKLKEIASRIVIGDPTSEDTTVGPLISKTQYDKVNGYINRAIERGEKLVYGGPLKVKKGYFVQPTFFDDVKPKSELFRDEIFGPVLSFTSFETEEEALELANDSEYGLAAAVWTRDINRMNKFASKIKCGIMQCNTLFSEFPGAPAGGYNNSGYGREFGREAITEYTQIKTIWVAYSDDYSDWV